MSANDLTTIPAKKRRTRAVQIEDVEFIATQVARGLTETHAVDLLGKFSYAKWTHYKQKPGQASKVAQLFSRMKSARMANLVEQIEVAGIVDKAAAHKVRFDWRAAQMLASLHDYRYGNQQAQASVTTTTNNLMISVGGEAAAKQLTEAIYGRGTVQPAKAVKQLPDVSSNEAK